MMTEQDIAMLSTSLIGWVAGVLVLIGTIYMLVKHPSIPVYLLAAGALMRLATHLFYTVGIYVVRQDYERFQQLFTPVQIVSYLGIFAFTAGFILFVRKYYAQPGTY